MDEDEGVARLTITTDIPQRFTNATGALFYTEDGTATAGGDQICTCIMINLLLLYITKLVYVDHPRGDFYALFLPRAHVQGVM